MTTTFLRRTSAPRVVAALAAAALLALGTAAPASAHNYVSSSTPADGETLSSVPERFSLTTNEPMLVAEGSSGAETAGFAIQVTDAAGLYYGDGCLEVAGTTMGMGAGLGAADDYTLTYQFISADGHTVSDSFGFSYTPSGDAAVQAGLAEPPVCGEASVTGEAPAEPAPSEVPDASSSAEPEETLEASSPAPSDGASATDTAQGGLDETAVVLGIVGGVLALILVAGIVTAIVLRRRAAESGAGSTPVD